MLTRIGLCENFARLLEQERKHMNLSQQQMADKMGISICTYKNMIKGKTSKIDLYNAYTLFRCDESSILQLFDYPAELRDIAAKLMKLSPLKLVIVKRIVGTQKTGNDDGNKKAHVRK